MTKVFICIPWFLPAFRAGGPVQSIANLVAQSELDCWFYIFCGHTDLNDEPLEGLVINQWTKFNEQTEVYYAGRQNRRAVLHNEIRKIDPDKIFIIGMYSRDFTIAPLLMGHYNKIIISARGMLHPGALSQKSLKKKIFLSWFRMKGFHSKCLFHATDEQEAEHIRRALGSQVRVSVAGNFPRLFRPAGVGNKEKAKLTLICLALISPMKNHLLVLEALAGVEASVDFHIIGPVKDASYWQACQAAISQLPPHIKVHVHGEIPPDRVGDWLSQAQVFIMPSKSENFGHSLLEAMSAGLPVITSQFTPWNRLEENKAGLNIELNQSSVIRAVSFFAGMDQPVFQDWRQGASRYAHAVVDTEELKQKYRSLFGSGR